MSETLSPRAEIVGTANAIKLAADRIHAISRFMIRNLVGTGFIHQAMSNLARTSTFRLTFAIAGTFLLGSLLLSGFIYWQSAVYLIAQNDALLVEQMRVFVSDTPEQRLAEIKDRLLKDPNHVKIAALFDAAGRGTAR